jgi:hypothetical protein
MTALLTHRTRLRLAGPTRLSLAVLFAALATSRVAGAAPTLAEKATAQALFEDGLQLMGAKRYAEACPKLEESERLDPALGTRFRLSECEEAVGRLASAWAGFLEVADLAHTSGQADRETLARKRAAALEPKLSRVKVDVAQPDTPGLEVAHDSVVVGKGQWGTPVPIDPGTYTVTATAPGKKPWRGSVTVAEGGATATLLVPTLDVAPPELVAAAAIPLAVGTVGQPAPAEHVSSTGKVAGWVLVGAGGAALISGGVMALVAKGDYDSAGSNCSASTCNAAGESTINGARSLANVATGVFIGGAVVAVAGVVVVLVSPSSKSSSASAGLRVGPRAAFLMGTF